MYSTCEYTYFDHDKVGWSYNLGYELATVNVDGTGLQRLTDNLHFENYPVWSPDGARVAFIAHNDYSRRADYDYNLFPDHYDPHNSEIFTKAADGTDERVVPNTKGVGLYPPVWSPTGERLAFTSHEVKEPSVPARYWVSKPLERILYTVRLDGSELSRIGKATTLPTWSPDGERVAFGLDDGVYTVRFDGTDLLEVLDDFRANEVSWSSDGTELLLASGGGVYVVRPDGSGLRRLGPPIGTTAATWSPDGSMIAARHETQRRSWPWPLVIFIMNRDGTDVRFVAELVIEDDALKGPVVKILSLAPIDPATCSNGVVVPDPEVTRSGGRLQGADSVAECVRSACDIGLDDGYADRDVAGDCRRGQSAACAGAAASVQRRDRHHAAGHRQVDDAGGVGPLRQQSADRCDTI